MFSPPFSLLTVVFKVCAYDIPFVVIDEGIFIPLSLPLPMMVAAGGWIGD